MVLVTGGTGFLGAYIISTLVSKGIPVRAIRRSSKLPFFIPAATWANVQWIDSDILDVVGLDEAMEGCWGVIHAAALVSFHNRDHSLMHRVNIEGTRNVVNLAIERGIHRFVHISSVAAVGRTATGSLVTEDKKWEDTGRNTEYAISKHHAELEVWRGFSEELPGVILNPSTILGFGDWHASSCALFKNAYKEFPWYTEGLNGFVGVEDVATAAVDLLHSDITEKRFIINAENRTFKELFDMMADGFNKRRPHRKATPFLGEVAWRLEALKHLFRNGHPLLTRESARVAQSKTIFDNSAVLQALPHFAFTPLAGVIQNSCEKYKAALRDGLLSV